MITLMIADDEVMTRRGLEMLNWHDHGFQLVGIAANGIEARQLSLSQKPDLLLTDIRMPGLDGLALMDSLNQQRCAPKVIFITAYHQLDYALKAIQLGALGFVLKPTDPDEIMAACLKAKATIIEERQRQHTEEELRDQLEEYALTLQGKHTSHQESSSKHPVIQQMLQTMEKQYMKDITIEHIADKNHFNADYLSRLFKKETGDNFLNTLTRIRMQKAVELLANPHLEIYKIAEQVGIRDARYFGQVFKKRYGLTPNEFRKKGDQPHA